jgi:hypothetical protein
MYTIYEIPGIKVGCDYNWPLRAHEQNVDPETCIILQQETDIIQASIDEIWWQIELDYPVDNVPYFQMVEMNRKRAPIGGKKAYELKVGIFGMSEEATLEKNIRGGETQGKKHAENGTGIFSISKEAKLDASIRGGQTQGKKSYEQKVGLFKYTKEERRAININGGIATSKIRKKCPHCDKEFDVRNYVQHIQKHCKILYNKS